jgi:hypothetical protein
MNYKGIETKDEWKNGNWYTYFSKDGEVIKTVEWRGTFGEKEIMKVIDYQIIPFI